MDTVSLPAWRGFDAWLNRNPQRSADELTEHSGIRFQYDELIDCMVHRHRSCERFPEPESMSGVLSKATVKPAAAEIAMLD